MKKPRTLDIVLFLSLFLNVAFLLILVLYRYSSSLDYMFMNIAYERVLPRLCNPETNEYYDENNWEEVCEDYGL